MHHATQQQEAHDRLQRNARDRQVPDLLEPEVRQRREPDRRQHEGQDARIKPLSLTAADRADLVAFLESLTGSNVGALAADARTAAIGDR